MSIGFVHYRIAGFGDADVPGGISAFLKLIRNKNFILDETFSKKLPSNECKEETVVDAGRLGLLS